MPNFHASEFSEPLLPAKMGKSEFLYQAISDKGERLVMVRCESECFFIKASTHKNGYLFKADKITRPSHVALLQQALVDFRTLINAKSHLANIEPKHQKTTAGNQYLKKMQYFADDFVTDKEIVIEVGFGSGRHLLYQAKKNPDKIIIGLEIHKPSIEQVLKQCTLQNIENILIADYDARVFFEFLPSNSVKQIFVHFPIPWDKKPHRRVISQRFLTQAKRVLLEGGTLELRTDSDNYFTYSFFEFMQFPKASVQVYKNRELQVSSKYEDRWKKQEKNIYDLILHEDETALAVAKIGRIAFTKPLNFLHVKSIFANQTLQKDACFAHLEEIYERDEVSGVLRVSFGGAQKNEHKYIMIEKDSVSYLPDSVLATKDNLNAHKLIEEILYGKCD
ncbi:MAG: tRNA (guanosine(46)-N7)-methyltransferase TrmB [Sulfurospirillum sp.]|nr:tRNA (guanosine(46)-N7)-methyltransferase TrmB [Sulfurospirillum sp.]